MTVAESPRLHVPLDGPFMSAARLTDYSDDPGYAILLPERADCDEEG